MPVLSGPRVLSKQVNLCPEMGRPLPVAAVPRRRFGGLTGNPRYRSGKLVWKCPSAKSNGPPFVNALQGDPTPEKMTQAARRTRRPAWPGDLWGHGGDLQMTARPSLGTNLILSSKISPPRSNSRSERPAPHDCHKRSSLGPIEPLSPRQSCRLQPPLEPSVSSRSREPQRGHMPWWGPDL